MNYRPEVDAVDIAAGVGLGTRQIEPNAAALQDAFILFLDASRAMEAQQTLLNQQVEGLKADLVRTSASLKLVLNALPAAVIVLEDHQVKHFNSAARQLIPGLEVDQPWSIPADWQVGCGPDEYQIPSEVAPRTYQLQQRQADQVSVIQIQDITENLGSKEAQERLQRLVSMGEMSAGIAHQIRTPLATSMLYAEHLMNPSLTQTQQREFAESLKRQLMQLNKLSSGMLEFVRTTPPEIETFQLQDLIKEAVHGVAGISSHGEVQISALPMNSCHIKGHRASLLAALVGILENAVQSSHSGQSIEIDVTQAGVTVLLSIRDYGKGIDECIQPRLFEPFATTRTTGTGLGLAIARNTIRNHGGDISARNHPDGGAVFTVSLPAITKHQYV